MKLKKWVAQKLMRIASRLDGDSQPKGYKLMVVQHLDANDLAVQQHDIGGAYGIVSPGDARRGSCPIVEVAYNNLYREMKARSEGRIFNAERFSNAKEAIDTFHIESRCEEPNHCGECEWKDSRLGRWCFANWLYTRKGEKGNK